MSHHTTTATPVLAEKFTLLMETLKSYAYCAVALLLFAAPAPAIAGYLDENPDEVVVRGLRST
jgi:hypothetical protein